MHVRNRRDDCLVPSVERAMQGRRAGPECPSEMTSALYLIGRIVKRTWCCEPCSVMNALVIESVNCRRKIIAVG
jgi:hypothetical protein